MKEKRRVSAMSSKYSEVVLLRYEAYSSMKNRNFSEKKKSSRESLKCDGKTISRKKKKTKPKASEQVLS